MKMMKKRFMCAILATCMVTMLSIPAIAQEDEEQFTPLPEKGINTLVSELDPSTYGGVYKDGDTYVIAVIEGENIEASIQSKIARSGTRDNITFVQVKFSQKDLEQARDNLMEYVEKFSIVACGIDSENNTLTVWTKDLSEENKASISESAKIDGINFKLGKDIVDEEHGEDIVSSADESDQENLASPRIDILGGNWVYKNGRANSTLALYVTQNMGTANEKKGYVTCGHGYANGDTVYYNGTSTALGKTAKVAYNTQADASFIQSSVNGSRKNKYGHVIDYQGNVRKGEVIVVAGVHGSQSSEVTATGVSIYFTNNSGVQQIRKNTFSYEATGKLGNSGSAIVSLYNGSYSIGGIQSSAMVVGTADTECFATQWDVVRSALNISA